MLPYTPLFKEALVNQHTLRTRAEILRNGIVQYELHPISGNVSVSVDQDTRRRANVTMVDPTGELTPRTAQDLLAPLGNELRLYRGLTLIDGTEEMKPLATINISKTHITDSGDTFTIEVEGYDRSRRIRRSRWTEPYLINAGTNYVSAIENAVASRATSTMFRSTPTNQVTPKLSLGIERDHDPWKLITSMAGAIGYEVYFDQMGVCVLRPVPSPQTTTDVVWDYIEGNTATILSYDRTLSDEFVYNHVVVTSESSTAGTPVRADAKDTDPSSATYYLGDFGDVPYFLYSKFIRSQEQAQAAADAILTRVLGTSEVLQFPLIVNPCHEENDLIRVTRQKSGIEDYYIIDSFNIPLEASGVMNATCRTKRTLIPLSI